MTCIQAAAYALHYTLLGNFGAAGSAGVLQRALRRRGLFPLAPGSPPSSSASTSASAASWAEGIPGWLPVIGNSIGTLALFFLHGIAMRATLLSATAMILTTNVLSGSIGGTVLEIFIATAKHRHHLPPLPPAAARGGVRKPKLCGGTRSLRASPKLLVFARSAINPARCNRGVACRFAAKNKLGGSGDRVPGGSRAEPWPYVTATPRYWPRSWGWRTPRCPPPARLRPRRCRFSRSAG